MVRESGGDFRLFFKTDRRTWIALLSCITAALFLVAPLATAKVVVASTQTTHETVVNQSLRLDGGAYSYYELPLQAGAHLKLEFQVKGGLDDAIQTWLVDLDNFQLFKSGQLFSTWEVASPQITERGSSEFTAPATGIYYLVLDNRANAFGRNVTLHVGRKGVGPNTRADTLRQIYEKRYEGLRAAFVFPEFDIHVQSCGFSNAFSNPNITMCTELFDEVQGKGVPAAEIFVFYHEVGHSLLNLWLYPGFDNEDTADEFAAAILMMMDQEDVILQAAQWWASNDSHAEAGQKLFVDDRHSISIQRARNMLNWLNREDEILSRWMSIMIPNLTEVALRDVATGSPETADHIRLMKAAQIELQRRRLASAEP